MALPMTALQIRILDPRLGSTDFPLPTYATEHAAGLDLRAMLDEPLYLAPGQAQLIPTGMAVWIQDPSLCGLLMPRSSLGHKKGLVLGNLVGLIDADYQGPLMISAWNRHATGEPIVITPGERIAQLVLAKVERPIITVVEQFAATVRGEGGFGSTGRR